MRSFLAACVGLMWFVSATTLRADTATLVALTRSLDLGDVAIDAAPTTGVLMFSVKSSSPWMLSVTKAPGVLQPEIGSQPGEADVAVQINGAEWLPLEAGAPMVAMQHGGASDAQVMSLPIQIRAGWHVGPGVRKTRLRFQLGDAAHAEEVEISYRVERAVRLTADARPFEVVVEDPSQPRIYPSQARVYRVWSNAPWLIRGSLVDSLRVSGSDSSLGPDALLVGTADGRQQPIAVGVDAITLAEGGPTGAEGQTVEITLAVRAANHASAGAYAGELRIVAEGTPNE